MTRKILLAILTGMALAFLLNFLVVSMGYRPVFYCGFKDIGWGLFQPFQLLMSLTGCILVMAGLVSKRYNWAFLGVLMVLGAYVIPDWGRVLFALGKGCA